jgi:hypothetical protein
MFTSSGVLNYNEGTSEFRIASPEKLISRSDTGNYIALHTESCSMEGDGLIDMKLNMPDVDFKPYGVINYNAATKMTTMNVSGGLEFYMEKGIIDLITEDIKTTEGIGTIDFGRTTLKQAITETVGKEDAENIETKYVTSGNEPDAIKKLPKEMESAPFYLANLRLEWIPRANGLVSQPITGLVAAHGEPLFRDFEVRVMIRYFSEGKNSGTTVGLLITLPGKEGVPGNTYFISLESRKGGTNVFVYTTNKELSNYLAELKPDKLNQKKIEIIPQSKPLRLNNFNSYIPD